MNEFIKKINEIDVLNKKIDNLTNLLEKMIQQQIQINKSGICENGSYI
jgi:DNA replicative helicase MCM subunit Mcm2 (Cdc46/Mcm family)